MKKVHFLTHGVEWDVKPYYTTVFNVDCWSRSEQTDWWINTNVSSLLGFYVYVLKIFVSAVACGPFFDLIPKYAIAFDSFIQDQTEEFSVLRCFAYTGNAVWTAECTVGLIIQVTAVTVTVMRHFPLHGRSLLRRPRGNLRCNNLHQCTSNVIVCRMRGRLHKHRRSRRLLQDIDGQDDVVSCWSHVQCPPQERAPACEWQHEQADGHQFMDFSKFW